MISKGFVLLSYFISLSNPLYRHQNNVLIDKDRVPILIDFGLSKTSDASQSSATTTGVGGAVRWLAPELFQYETKTTASDVYAVGMVIVEVGLRISSPPMI